jgi:hypothetical protein
MSNRFNQIFQYPEYKPVGLNFPFQELAYVGERAKKDYEDTVTDAGLVNTALKQVKYAPWDSDYKKQFDQEYTAEMQKVTDMIVNKDPNARQAILNLKGKLSTDPRIPIFEYNYAQDDAYNKDRATMLKDQSYRDYNDSFAQQINSRTGLSQVPFQGIKGYTDPYDDMADIMGQMASSSSGSSGEKFVYDRDGSLGGIPGTIIKYGASGEVMELSPEDIQRIAQISAPVFLSRTKGGESFKDEITYREMLPNLRGQGDQSYIDLGGVGYNPDDYLYDRTIQELTAVGMKQAFRKSKTGQTVDLAPEYMQDKSTTSPYAPAYLPSTVFESGIFDKYKTAAGRSNNTAEFRDPSGGPRPAGLGERGMFVPKQPESKAPLTAEESTNYNLAANILNKRANTPEEQRAIWNEYVDWFGKNLQYEGVAQRMDSKQIEELDKLKFKNLEAMNYSYIPLADPSATPITGEQLINSFDGGTAVTSQILGADNPWGVKGPANLVTQLNKDGQIVNKWIEIPNRVNPADAVLSDMYQVKYNPTYKHTISLDVNHTPQDFIIQAAPSFDSKGKVIPGKISSVKLTYPDGREILRANSVQELFDQVYPKK